jgi:uncharacterized membrane protein YkvA (DUF1232 family)
MSAMSQERKPELTPPSVGALTQFVRTLRLVWRLLNDSRVPALPKLIIPAALVYLLSPVDLIPDLILGLGQLDDLGVLALAVAMFIELCPRDVVEEHRRAIAASAGSRAESDENVIDGTFHEVDDHDSK